MATYTVGIASNPYVSQYPLTYSATQDIQINDTISLTITVGTSTLSQAMSLSYGAYAIAVFSLVNCTVSPSTNVRSGSTITVTPVNNNATYSCTAVITHYHENPVGGSAGTNRQTKTFVLSGAVGVLPIYGLEIFDANGNSRLRYDNRLCKFHSVFTGTLSGNSGTLSVPNMAADGTWGINNQAQNSIVQCFIGTNAIGLNQASFGTSGNLYGGNLNYEIIVFRV
jgi:hypothetical protein